MVRSYELLAASSPTVAACSHIIGRHGLPNQLHGLQDRIDRALSTFAEVRQTLVV
jgi:hypothetical protein